MCRVEQAVKASSHSERNISLDKETRRTCSGGPARNGQITPKYELQRSKDNFDSM